MYEGEKLSIITSDCRRLSWKAAYGRERVTGYTFTSTA